VKTAHKGEGSLRTSEKRQEWKQPKVPGIKEKVEKKKKTCTVEEKTSEDGGLSLTGNRIGAKHRRIMPKSE